MLDDSQATTVPGDSGEYLEARVYHKTEVVIFWDIDQPLFYDI